MIRLYDEFERLVEAFDRACVPFAVCGGIAVAVYGHVRATEDIDVLVAKADLDRARAVLRSCGYTLAATPMSLPIGPDSHCVIHRVTRVVGEEHLTVDMILVTPVLPCSCSDPSYDLFMEIATVYRHRDRPGDAEHRVEQYTRALGQRPGDAVALAERGTAPADLGQLDKAEQDADAAMSAAPQAGLSWLLRALIADRRGHLDDARSALVRAAELMPGDDGVAARLRELDERRAVKR